MNIQVLKVMDSMAVARGKTVQDVFVGELDDTRDIHCGKMIQGNWWKERVTVRRGLLCENTSRKTISKGLDSSVSEIAEIGNIVRTRRSV